MPKQFPKLYYGLHFYPGVAEYNPAKGDPFRVFITEDAIRKMGPSFEGKPLFVKHKGDYNLAKLENEADGYVVRSFFNKSDGKHWTEFMVVSDSAHEAIRSGWKLSNCYVPTSTAPAGIHNGLSYDKEVVEGEYDHLALVDDPRYEESMILTPDEFKEYNRKKEVELEKVANSMDESKGEKKMGFSLFKRQKVENSSDLTEMLVVLPKSKKEISIANALEECDKIFNMHGYANDEHMVKMDDEEMSVKDLAKAYGKMKNKMGEMEKEKAEAAAAVKNEDDSEMEDVENDQDEKPEPEMKNDQDEKPEPDLENKKGAHKNSADKKPEEKKAPVKKTAGEMAQALMNASDTAAAETSTVDLSVNQLARGKSRYGSAS